MGKSLISFGLTLLIMVSFIFGMVYYPTILVDGIMIGGALVVFVMLWLMVDGIIKDWLNNYRG